MRILYVAMKHDYGRPEQGFSFEHYNFYDALVHMGHDILYFDFMTLLQSRGREGMNQRLKQVARAEKPDVMFTVLFTDELDRSAILAISDDLTVTINWFCDDHWRFESFSRHWAGCFQWVVTTAASAIAKYERLGFPHLIKSQWACNHFLYRKQPLPLIHDVSFVGQPHGNRREIIGSLDSAGISVQAWGKGWPAGRIDQEKMIQVFNQSRINLNLTNASVDGPPPVRTGAVRRWTSRALDGIPFGGLAKRAARRAAASLLAPAPPAGRIAPPPEVPGSSPASGSRPLDQIKGRNFEIPGCGGFLLTGRADDLEHYYDIGREIVCFDDESDLIEKVHYYLTHEQERAAVAKAGWERTLREHTYVHRFEEIFQRCGLAAAVRGAGDEGSAPGSTEEIS